MRSILPVCVLALLIAGCTESMKSFDTVAAAGEPLPQTTAPPTATAAPPETPKQPAAQRKMIYNASVAMVVVDVADAKGAIRAIAEQAGGFMQSMVGDSIVVRVPAESLDDSLQSIRLIGEVTDEQVAGTDVTEQWHDLAIRLGNAQRARERLLALLDKAEKTEDLLKIEQEITRLTETIERIKGRQRYLRDAVALSTITVRLNSPVPQRQLRVNVPFPWVRDLAGDLINGTRPAGIDTNLFKRGIRLDLPEGFVKYYEQPDVTRAMAADGVLIKVHRHRNYDGGNLTFWSTLARRTLVESRSIAVDHGHAFELADGTPAMRYQGRRQIGGQTQRYMVILAVTSKRVFVYEAWGEAETLGKVRDAVLASAESIRP